MSGAAARVFLSAVALFIACATASASDQPAGLWYDGSGRGAIEITSCGGGLCGHLVWLKDPSHKEVCGRQIIGDVRPAGKGKWEGGWIYDPERDARYSVEITALGTDRLQVLGYLGTKFLSETHIWKRAPAGLKRCGT